MASTWVFQQPTQIKRVGEEKASWCAGWISPDGKRHCRSCGPGNRGKRDAERLAEKIQSQLNTGTYENKDRTTWAEFREEYRLLVLDGKGDENRKEMECALNHFERIIRPQKVSAITSHTIQTYVAKRRKERGQKRGSLVSPATINKELRCLRAVFRKARKLKYLNEAPDFEFLRTIERLPCWVPPEHFAELYHAANVATFPEEANISPEQWWKSLLVFAYLTGWRIGSILNLRRDDVDLETGLCFSAGGDNKGKRDQCVSLNPLVVDHLRAVQSLSPFFFPWHHSEKHLYTQLERIGEAAGVKPARGKAYYTFHDLRRGFATLNAGRLSADVLQALMQHRAYATTKGYIDLARQLKPAAHDIFVPDLNRRSSQGR